MPDALISSWLVFTIEYSLCSLLYFVCHSACTLQTPFHLPANYRNHPCGRVTITNGILEFTLSHTMPYDNPLIFLQKKVVLLICSPASRNPRTSIRSPDLSKAKTPATAASQY